MASSNAGGEMFQDEGLFADDTALRRRVGLAPNHDSDHNDSNSSVDSLTIEHRLNSTMVVEPSFRFRDIFSPTLVVLLLWKTFHRVTFSGICFAVILWASVFLYISFYYSYIPALDVAHSIHFQFDGTCKDTCTVPVANVLLSNYKTPSFFAKGQSYKIRLDLSMPESDVNWDQGMFMARIQLQDSQQRFIATASRPAILKYKSFALRCMAFFWFWPYLIMGFKEETQHLSIVLIEDYLDGVKPNMGTATNAQIDLQCEF